VTLARDAAVAFLAVEVKWAVLVERSPIAPMNDPSISARRQLAERWLLEVNCRRLALTWAHSFGLADAETIAHDLEQEIRLEILAKIDKFDSIARMIVFARIVARNKVVDLLRKRGKETELPSEITDHQDEAGELERKEQFEMIRACLDELQELARRVLEMKYFENRSYSAIAEAVGTSDAGARKTAERARDALRRCLKQRTRDRLPGQVRRL
jgi:RNA polymerase sigma-70 factor (ECF subfamily)